MPKFVPRRVRNAEERNSGRGTFITLKKTNDQFLGYALFVADPELDDNPGYFEYFEHYTPATGYCPCAASEDQECPLCAEGDSPSTRAKSMWLVVDSEDDDVAEGQVKIFNLNWSMVQEFAEDGADMLGRLYRVKRLEGKGVYSIRPKTGKLTKTQLNAARKEFDSDLLEKQAVRQMNRVFEEMDVAEAMEDTDDDNDKEPEEETKATKGKSTARKGKPEPESDSFDPDEDTEFDGVVTVVKVNKRSNIATVETDDGTEFDIYGTGDTDLTEFTKGDKITVEAAKDEDGDFVVDSAVAEDAEPEPDEEPEPDAGEAPDEVDEEEVTISSVNSDEDTITVEMEDGTEFVLFFLGDGEDSEGNDWSELDIDDFKDGQKIVISAAKDEDGDMLASVFPKAVGGTKKKATGRKKAAA